MKNIFFVTSFCALFLSMPLVQAEENFDGEYLYGSSEITLAPEHEETIEFSFKNTGSREWGNMGEENPVILEITSGEYDLSNSFQNWGWINTTQIKMEKQEGNLITFAADITAPQKIGEYTYTLHLTTGEGKEKTYFGEEIPFILSTSEITPENKQKSAPLLEEEKKTEKTRIRSALYEQERKTDLVIQKIEAYDEEISNLKHEKVTASPERRKEIERELFSLKQEKEALEYYHISNFQEQQSYEAQQIFPESSASVLMGKITTSSKYLFNTHPDLIAGIFLASFTLFFWLLKRPIKEKN